MLNRVMPNPFTSTMQYSYRVPAGANQPVDVGLYDMAGRRVRNLASGSQPAGSYTVTWDGRDESGTLMAPGVYFLRARVAGVQNTNRVIFLKH
jgi:flagellar hook assembly protein FlgD